MMLFLSGMVTGMAVLTVAVVVTFTHYRSR